MGSDFCAALPSNGQIRAQGRKSTSMATSAKRKTAKSADAGVSPELIRKLYRDMLLIRRFEEKAGQLYGMGLIGGFCHLYIEQEAVVTGFQSVLEKRDNVITAYHD